MRVSGVLQGRLKNLEIEHAAALSLRSQQYSMKLLSATGTGRELVSAVLGLGSQRVEPRFDAATGLAEYVDVAGQFTLHDLRADLLDADSEAQVANRCLLQLQESLSSKLRRTSNRCMDNTGFQPSRKSSID